MKKHLFFPAIIAWLNFACSSPTASNENASTSAPENAPQQGGTSQQEIDDSPSSLPADSSFNYYFVGDFEVAEYGKGEKPSYSNLINVSIDLVRGDSIFGHSVVAGNSRPFKGSISESDKGFEVIAREPGDDPYDGVFEFNVNKNKSIIKGTWNSYKSSLAVTGRRYELIARSFRYDPALGLEDLEYAKLYDGTDNELDGEFTTAEAGKFNASAVELKKEDIENMYQGDLEVMRNAIYARHGYSFKNRKMRYVFDNHVDWYIPVSTDVTAELTPLEKKNIELIKRYEKHAAKYYDSFGR